MPEFNSLCCCCASCCFCSNSLNLSAFAVGTKIDKAKTVDKPVTIHFEIKYLFPFQNLSTVLLCISWIKLQVDCSVKLKICLGYVILHFVELCFLKKSDLLSIPAKHLV